MGKYMRKAKITGEVAVMELSQASLGVRTRAKTLALQRLQKTTTSSSYLQLRSRRLEKPPLVAASESKKTKEICKENPSTVHRLLSDSTNSGSVGSVSLGCLKKNEEAAAAAAETDGPPENIEVGIEASFGENILEIDGRERNIRETTPSSLIRDSDTLGTPGSTTRPTNSTATNRRIQIHRNIPTTHEMEEFFTGAEQQQQRIFTEKCLSDSTMFANPMVIAPPYKHPLYFTKRRIAISWYNYDPVNDLPLPGRYEWVTLDQ